MTGREGLARLDELVQARRQIEEQIDGQVGNLAAAGFSWPVLADVLGVSRQAVRQAHVRRRAATTKASTYDDENNLVG